MQKPVFCFLDLRMATLSTVAITALSLLSTSNAHAILRDSATFTNLIPVQTSTGSNGTLFTPNFTVSGYGLTKIRFSGNFEEINGTTGDFAAQNRIQIVRPDGVASIVQLSTLNSGYTGVFNFDVAQNFAEPLNITSGSQWQFRYYNTLNDPSIGDTPTGPRIPDARINSLTVELFDDAITLPQPPPLTANLGTITSTGDDYTTPDTTFDVEGGLIHWLAFTLDSPASINNFLDIDTVGSTVTGTLNGLTIPSRDTNIGIYNALGELVAYDDRDGGGSMAAISLGATNPLRGPVGTGAAGNGRDGGLPAGTYYMALGGYNANYGPNFGVTVPALITTGIIRVNMRTNIAPAVTVPEGSTVALLVSGLGLLGATIARRRKTA